MAATKAFFDTNILLYLLFENEAKAEQAEEILAAGGVSHYQSKSTIEPSKLPNATGFPFSMP